MNALARIGFVLIPTLLGCASASEYKGGSEPIRPDASILMSRSHPEGAAGKATAVVVPQAQQDGFADEVGAVDLYGNDVTDAVATYKLDAEGSLYELHSPQTELPRLGSPKS